MMALCYCAHDPQYKNFFSQNDIVKYVENQKEYLAEVISSQNDIVRIHYKDVSGNAQNDVTKDVSRQMLKIVERYVEKVGATNIPVQKNDLVCFTYENQNIMGIVTDMDVSKQSVTLKLLSQKGLSTSTNVSIRHLRFCAKSCFFNMDVNRSIQSNTLSQMKRTTGRFNQPIHSHYQNNGLATNQPANGIPYNPNAPTIEAILVDAPCVVKVVSVDADPNNYDDLMHVESMDGDHDVPSVLPLVRMKCGTILVVRAPPT